MNALSRRDFGKLSGAFALTSLAAPARLAAQPNLDILKFVDPELRPAAQRILSAPEEFPAPEFFGKGTQTVQNPADPTLSLELRVPE